MTSRCVLCGRPLPAARRKPWCAGTATAKACSRPVRDRDAVVQIATAPGRWEIVELLRSRVVPAGSRLSYGLGDGGRGLLWEER